jgi:hypothetical protein
MSNEGLLDSFEKITAKLREHDAKFSAQYAATDDLIKRVCKLERELAALKSSTS